MGLLAVGPGPKIAKSAGSGPIVPPPPTRWGTGVKRTRYRGTNVVRVDTRRCAHGHYRGPATIHVDTWRDEKLGRPNLGRLPYRVPPVDKSAAATAAQAERGASRAPNRSHGIMETFPIRPPPGPNPMTRRRVAPRAPERLQVSKSVAITSPARTQHVCRRRQAESAPAATRPKLSTTRGAGIGQEWRLALAP